MKVATVRKADGTYDYRLNGVRGGVSTVTPWGARVQGLRAAKIQEEVVPEPTMVQIEIQGRAYPVMLSLAVSASIVASGTRGPKYGNGGMRDRQRRLIELAEAMGIDPSLYRFIPEAARRAVRHF